MYITYETFKKLIPNALLNSTDIPERLSIVSDYALLQKNFFYLITLDKSFESLDLVKIFSQCAGIIVSYKYKDFLLQNKIELDNKLIIYVKDIQQTVYRLAQYVRSQKNNTLIALTGSLGTQTTTMLFEHIAHYAGKKIVDYACKSDVYALAYSLINADQTADTELYRFDVGCVESLKHCVELLQPTTAIIATLAHTGLEHCGSLAQSAAYMREIFSFFKEDSIGIINGDFKQLSNVSYPHPVIRFGRKMTNQIQARKIKSDGVSVSCVLKIYQEKYHLTVPAFHETVIESLLAAVALAQWASFEAPTIIAALKALNRPVEQCATIELKAHKATLIDDGYTPSPESMKSALRALQTLKTGGKKIAVLSDMPGLGKSSAFWHRQLGRFLRKTPSLKHLILVGNEVEWTRKAAPRGLDVEVVSSWDAAVVAVQKKLEKDAVVLMKGPASQEYADSIKQLSGE